VLFATEDGGVTWKPDRILTGLHDASQESTVHSVVVDSTWIGSVGLQDGVCLNSANSAQALVLRTPRCQLPRNRAFRK